MHRALHFYHCWGAMGSMPLFGANDKTGEKKCGWHNMMPKCVVSDCEAVLILFFSVVELSGCPGPQSLQEHKELETIMLQMETTPRAIRALLPSPCRSLRKPREGRQQGNTSLCNHLLVTAGTAPVCTWHKPIRPFHNKVNVHQNGKWTRMNHGSFQCIYPLAQIQVH